MLAAAGPIHTGLSSLSLAGICLGNPRTSACGRERQSRRIHGSARSLSALWGRVAGGNSQAEVHYNQFSRVRCFHFAAGLRGSRRNDDDVTLRQVSGPRSLRQNGPDTLREWRRGGSGLRYEWLWHFSLTISAKRARA